MVFEKLWTVSLDVWGMIQGQCSCSGGNYEFRSSMGLFIVKERYYKWTLWVRFIASIGCPDFHYYFVIENTAGYSAYSMKSDIVDAVWKLFSGSGHTVSWFVGSPTLHMLWIMETALLMSVQMEFQISCGLKVFVEVLEGSLMLP